MVGHNTAGRVSLAPAETNSLAGSELPPPWRCTLGLLPQAKVGWNNIRVRSPIQRVEGRTLKKKSPKNGCNKEV